MEILTASIEDAGRAIGIGRTKTYELIAEGRLTALKLGRRTLVTTASIRKLVSDLEGAAPEKIPA